MTKKIVGRIFSDVSKVYDLFLNFITVGRINVWQKDLLNLMGDNGNRLDVGTGTGEVLKKSKNEGLKVGIDLALGMLKEARKKCPGCYFLLADAENMPFKDGSFKTITLSLAYRHLTDREAFLREARRVLKEKGRIGILDINRIKGTPLLVFMMNYPIKPFGLLIFGREKWEFFVHSLKSSLSLEEVKMSIERSGFKVEKLEKKFLGFFYILKAKKL
ncbi:MAG: class I SAM-dependent methyltransferase [Aquificaceae bacterium]